MTEPNCPPGVLEIAAEINTRILPFYVHPYLQYDSDGPDDWRLRLCAPDATELIRYIVPEEADPHTMSLMVTAAKNWGKNQFIAGRSHAIDKIANHFRSIV